MSDDTITLRSPAPDEMAEALKPLALAFGEEATEAEFLSERPLMEPERFVNAFDGAARIGVAGAFTFRMTVPGGEVGAAGITAVGVRPDHRRRGVMRRMMSWLLDDARSRGEPVAILTASEAAIYQRFGFGQATVQATFSVDPTRVRFRSPVGQGSGGRIRIVDAAEAAVLCARVYEAIRPVTPGAISRSEDKWRRQLVADAEWMRGGNGPKHRAVLEVGGQPRGYAIYRLDPDWDASGPASQLLAMEVIGVDAVAEQALWEWLFAMDLLGNVRGWRGRVPHPLQHWLLEPRRLGLTVGDGLWLRILDLPETLAARTYLGTGRVVLEVEDDLIDSNAGRWQVEVEGGRATVTPTSAEPDLRLDIGALAAAYLGAFRFTDLAIAGRVSAPDPGVLQTTDALFTPSRAPWCSTPF